LQNDKYERKVVDGYLVDGFMGASDAIKAHTLPDGTVVPEDLYGDGTQRAYFCADSGTFKKKGDEEDARLGRCREAAFDEMADLLEDVCHTCTLCHRRWADLGPWHTPGTGAFASFGIPTQWCRGCTAAKKAKKTLGIWNYAVPFEKLFCPKKHLAPSLPDLTRGEKALVAAVQVYTTVVTARRRNGVPGAPTYNSAVTLVAKELTYVCEIPHLVTNISAFVIRSNGGDDDACRRAAGFGCNLGHVLTWLRHLTDNNVVWKDALANGTITLNLTRMKELEDFVLGKTTEYEGLVVTAEGSVMAVPVVDEAGTPEETVLHQEYNPGDDRIGSPGSGSGEDDTGCRRGADETVTVLQDLAGRRGIIPDLTSVINGCPAAEGDNTYPPQDLPGIEALIWPWLYPDGFHTYRGPLKIETAPRIEHKKDYIKHMLMLAGSKYRLDPSFAAVHAKWHKEAELRQQCSFGIHKDFKDLSIEDCRELIRTGDASLWKNLQRYLKDVAGSPEHMKNATINALAVAATVLHVEQHMPVVFSTASVADVYHPVQQLIPKFLRCDIGEVDKVLADLVAVRAGNPPGTGAPRTVEYNDHINALVGDSWKDRWETLTDYGAACLAQHALLDILKRQREVMNSLGDSIISREMQVRPARHDHEYGYVEHGQGSPRPCAIGEDGELYFRTAVGKQHFEAYFQNWIGVPGQDLWKKDELGPENPHGYKVTGELASEDSVEFLTASGLKEMEKKMKNKPTTNRHPAAHFPGVRIVHEDDPYTEAECAADPELAAAATKRDHARGMAVLQKHVCSSKCQTKATKTPCPKPARNRQMIIATYQGPIDDLELTTETIGDAVHQLLSGVRMEPRRPYACYAHTVGEGELYLECSKALAEECLTIGSAEIDGKTFTLADDAKYRDAQVCKKRFPHPLRPQLEVKRSAAKDESNGNPGRLTCFPMRTPHTEMSNTFQQRGLYGQLAMANTDLQLIPGPYGNIVYTLKYMLKVGQKNKLLNSQLETLLATAVDERGISDQSLASSYIIRTLVKFEQKHPMTALECFEYFLLPDPVAARASISRVVIRLAVGGYAGFVGEKKHVAATVRDGADGRAQLKVSPGSDSIVQAYGKRFWGGAYTYMPSDPECEDEEREVLARMTLYVFASSFEVVRGEEGKIIKQREKAAGVRISPYHGTDYTLEPDGDNVKVHVDGDFAQQALYLHYPWSWPEGLQGKNTATPAEAELYEASVKRQFAEHLGASTAAEQWLHYCHHHFQIANDLGCTDMVFGLEGNPQLRLRDLLIPLAAKPPDTDKDALRAAKYRDIVEGRRDKTDGVGSSAYEFTDLEENGEANGTSGSDAEASDPPIPLAQPAVPDVFEGVPQPPRDYDFNNFTGMFPTDEVIDYAERYISESRTAFNDWVAGSGEKPGFEPTYKRLHEQPDLRDKLEGEQLKALLCVRRALQRETNGNVEPVRLLLVGAAGTGKTFTVIQLVKEFVEHFGYADDLEGAMGAVRVVASSGVAASNCFGQTIHTFCGLKDDEDAPVPKQKDGKKSYMFRESAKVAIGMKDLKLLIIEEGMAVGGGMYAACDARLRQERGIDKPFGGVHVIILGDANQIPPVCDVAPYMPRPPHPGTEPGGRRMPTDAKGNKQYEAWRWGVYSKWIKERGLGAEVYHEAKGTDVIFLTEQKRQTDEEYAALLGRLKTGDCTIDDVEAAQTRTQGKMNKADWQAFVEDVNTTHLYTRNDKAEKMNIEMLIKANNGSSEESLEANPILVLTAVHASRYANSIRKAKTVNTQDAGGLPGQTYFRRGAKIMIRRNLITEAALVNGTIAWLVDIGISKTHPRADGLPNVVLIAVKQEDTTMPSFGAADGKLPNGDELMYTDRHGKRKPYVLLPITPQTTNSFGGKLKTGVATRTNFPYGLAYAMTAHKCQGLTLERVAAHIFANAEPGLDYVMWSRVSGLEAIVFVEDGDTALDFDRLQKIGYEDVLRARQRKSLPKRKSHIAFKIGEEEALRARSEETMALLEDMYREVMMDRRLLAGSDCWSSEGRLPFCQPGETDSDQGPGPAPAPAPGRQRRRRKLRKKAEEDSAGPSTPPRHQASHHYPSNSSSEDGGCGAWMGNTMAHRRTGKKPRNR
jgi:hypothetical protein